MTPHPNPAEPVPLDLREEISDIFASYGVDEPEFNPYKGADEVLEVFARRIREAAPSKIDWTKPDNHDSGCDVQFIGDNEGAACNCRVGGYNQGIDDTITAILDGLGIEEEP